MFFVPLLTEGLYTTPRRKDKLLKLGNYFNGTHALVLGTYNRGRWDF